MGRMGRGLRRRGGDWGLAGVGEELEAGAIEGSGREVFVVTLWVYALVSWYAFGAIVS